MEHKSKTRRRIMIIDDDRCVGEVLKERLEALGHEAIVFTDGCSALATIALESNGASVDLVLLDLSMPGMDGMTVLRELRHRHSEIPVIMMSAASERDAFAAAVRAGASDYLMKPVDLELLVQKRWT